MANKGHLYEAEDGFRWQLRAGNGRIVAESGEAYTTERKAQDAFTKVFDSQYTLQDEEGNELLTDGKQPEPATAAADKGGGAFDGLPQDPNHPLYSPLTVDGNKVRA
jgi:uncharacterized protein YegP (UPF0339 family)